MVFSTGRTQEDGNRGKRSHVMNIPRDPKVVGGTAAQIKKRAEVAPLRESSHF